MRATKFRAWHKEKGFMVDVQGIMFDGEEKYIVTDTDLNEKYDEPPDPGYTASLKEVELMQFIGTQDKNGKEIYEGDIVNTMAGIFEVQYASHQAKYILTIDGLNAFSTEDWNFLEVVGNIYENTPEVIE